ncbi:MAG: triose-phosphate isomerase [candidate division Zixibacteria bacterium]|nr:triose-phosphate isomerase [candidate division Zixibacteria bacterium]
MARVPFIAGNWKMNGDPTQAKILCAALVARSKDWPSVSGEKVAVALFPPFVSLATAAETLKGTDIILGAQNMHEAQSGAFTGEVSAPMLLTAGCRMVILGHSERRQYFGETDAAVNRKVLTALEVGLHPIVCVGETLEEREADRTEEIVGRQLAGGLKGLSEDLMQTVTIAYEPVWAIGTGKVATIQQAGEVHRFIRQWMADTLSRDVAEAVRIQYGGSVKPDNAEGLLADPDIDGALVGGASLDADQFDGIIRAVKP